MATLQQNLHAPHERLNKKSEDHAEQQRFSEIGARQVASRDTQPLPDQLRRRGADRNPECSYERGRTRSRRTNHTRPDALGQYHLSQSGLPHPVGHLWAPLDHVPAPADLVAVVGSRARSLRNQHPTDQHHARPPALRGNEIPDLMAFGEPKAGARS